ncbi:T6SS amidase immunity protein Tai4 family protein [Burkholderia catarinensis]|uniref:T6SS amidase immunity protein Tai4 family protein n=1 Tax=Burkholderia catarinensis TaxID=1108140 RepID=UPI0010083A78|nr:T6SS amidase immunity protein Tai4 family protein [Burkholderia catarinensis]
MHAPDAVRTRVAKYLARDYRNPVVEPEVGDVKCDFLKCVDPYHGEEPDTAAKRLVLRSNSPCRTENSRKPQ